MPRSFLHVIAGLALLPVAARAQVPVGTVAAPAFHAWYTYTADHRLWRRWGLHTEGQMRRAGWWHPPQQLLLRGAANYHLTGHLRLAAGYTRLESYPYGEYATGRAHENRIYQEADLVQPLGRLQLEHRARLEQRWQRPAAAPRATYLNRARYQLSAQLPLHGSEIDPGELYVVAYEEVFVGFGSNLSGQAFDQNRLYAALGYQFSAGGAVELGYLYQLNPQDNGRVTEHNHTLYMGVVFDVDARRSAQ